MNILIAQGVFFSLITDFLCAAFPHRPLAEPQDHQDAEHDRAELCCLMMGTGTHHRRAGIAIARTATAWPDQV